MAASSEAPKTKRVHEITRRKGRALRNGSRRRHAVLPAQSGWPGWCSSCAPRGAGQTDALASTPLVSFPPRPLGHDLCTGLSLKTGLLFREKWVEKCSDPDWGHHGYWRGPRVFPKMSVSPSWDISSEARPLKTALMKSGNRGPNESAPTWAFPSVMIPTPSPPPTHL